jgi:putative mRNA 3-end processing factor
MSYIRFLGGADEVGREAMIVDTDDEKILMDYGINVQTLEAPARPEALPDAVFLTHAHLDHSGFLPDLYRIGYNRNVFLTPVTKELCSLLLKDSMKVQRIRGMETKYTIDHIRMFESFAKPIGFNDSVEMNSSSIQFFDAGHIPGSASILITTNKKRILYTGDIKFENTELMKGAYQEFKDVDVLITETTYSYKNHPPRREMEKRLREHVTNVVQRGGIALLPCFAVGRTQEILLIVHDLGFPVYIDGMGIDATRIILNHKSSIRTPHKLKKAFSNATKLRRRNQRIRAIREPGIIITTSGMLQGGPVSFYMKHLHNRRDCSIVLLGYQIEDTPGRILLETGRYIHEDLDIKPKMDIKFMDFSAHCSRDKLIKFIEKINAEKTFLVHGEHTQEFSQELNEQGINAIAPENNEKFKL